MRSILIVTRDPSELSDLIIKVAPSAKIVHPDNLLGVTLSEYDAFALLGGTRDDPMLLHPFARQQFEKQLETGKILFAEFCGSVGQYYFDKPKIARYERLVVVDDQMAPSLTKGQIIQKQTALNSPPFFQVGSLRNLLICAPHLREYDRLSLEQELPSDSSSALWVEENNAQMYCTFQISNFLSARFSPRDLWKDLVAYILHWLSGERISAFLMRDKYSLVGNQADQINVINRALQAADQGILWYLNAGILQSNGCGGVLEGVFSEIDGRGCQKLNENLRADCWGESALPFYMRHLVYGDHHDLQISDNLIEATFKGFYCDSGRFKGMIRWTWEGWTVCYQDDVARAILPILWRQLYSGDAPFYSEALQALDFLASTTGNDGLRRMRTDTLFFSGDQLEMLAETPGECSSPHHAGYYAVALLLAGQLSKREQYTSLAVKSLSHLMEVYPNLQRIQSETQDLCRLILPLCYLYGVTGEPNHQAWLYRVIKDLEKTLHPSGAYLEWDSDYSAELHDAQQGNEAAVFARNGDPLVDLLYTNNWLPIALISAYAITGDELFWERWKQIAEFFASVQISSQVQRINGAWPRVIDVNRMEVMGMPDDVGWGPWSIESGWTMSQVISGLYMGQLKDEICQKTRDMFPAGKNR